MLCITDRLEGAGRAVSKAAAGDPSTRFGLHLWYLGRPRGGEACAREKALAPTQPTKVCVTLVIKSGSLPGFTVRLTDPVAAGSAVADEATAAAAAAEATTAAAITVNLLFVGEQALKVLRYQDRIAALVEDGGTEITLAGMAGVELLFAAIKRAGTAALACRLPKNTHRVCNVFESMPNINRCRRAAVHYFVGRGPIGRSS